MNKMHKTSKSATALAEEAMLKIWAKEKTFEKSLKLRESCPYFSFNDGPPFANGLPHFGHSLVTAIKDSMLRYKTMRGYYVPRRNGWDCHGLPVEFSIEKDFGVSGKKQILELGLQKFNAACRASIFKYKGDWEDFLTRIGRWSDYEHYYATVDTNYTESVWWTLSEINKKGLLYRGFKSLPYCPRCATPLSNFELNEGYRDDVPDPSVFVLFPLTNESVKELHQRLGLAANANKSWSDGVQGAAEQRTELYKDGTAKEQTQAATPQSAESGGGVSGSARKQDDAGQVYLLAWTTTPWTLPANAALAVDAKADYAFVTLKADDSTLILAKKRLSVLDLQKSDYKLLKTVKGQALIGLKYKPLYRPTAKNYSSGQTKNAWQVFGDDNVSLDDGSGILHVAPRYGETDLNLGLTNDLPLIESVNSAGQLIFGPKTALGKFFKEADGDIIADLLQQGRIFAAESGFKHTYPFCWRCDTPLMFFATTTWFVEVSKIRPALLKTAEDIMWVPAHIKTGRFGKWLEGARDWAISRNRYWGAPLPIWQNVADESDYLVVGSLAELAELAGVEALAKLPKTETGQPDLHRPFIDDIVIEKDGKTYKRVEEVLDCWFESGSMPVAQWHYPFDTLDSAEPRSVSTLSQTKRVDTFDSAVPRSVSTLSQVERVENEELFDKNLPADFITEAIDQTRLWFYVQHVISTILFNKPAFRQVIVTGFMMAADGQKLSKRLRNYPPVEEVFGLEGADALRLYLLSRSQGTENAEYMRFDRSAMTDIKRNVLDRLGNSFHFFQTYAQVDDWKAKELTELKSDNLLDQWILARLNQTILTSTKSADAYKISHAILPVFELVDDLSNWYIRRSRRRFWRPVHRSLGEGGKSENDTDKEQAYATLHFTLVRICQLMAPWAPFISDQLWRELIAGMNVPKSVHLSDWPLVGRSLGGGLSANKPDNASLKLLEKMAAIRSLVAYGLSQRAVAKIKVRQPLQRIEIPAYTPNFYSEELLEILKEELNVKEVNLSVVKPRIDADKAVFENFYEHGLPDDSFRGVQIDFNLTDELKAEGVMRELVRYIQNARKNAGLQVDDRIKLSLKTDSKEIQDAIKQFKEIIFSETLATSELGGAGDYSESVKVEGKEVKISLQKA